MSRSALKIVQQFFPGVREVVDSVRPAKIEVSRADANPRAQKNHAECALAVACKRKFNLDGVIISRSTAYLVKGRKARRFQLPPTTSREIVSFDRGAGFEPGTYGLSPVEPSRRLGTRTGTVSDSGNGEGKPKRFRHVTANIRTVLGGQEPDS